MGCKVFRTCAYCGKDFQTYRAEVKRGGGKYCSVSCSDKGHVKATDCVCQQCGKSFTQTPSRLALGYGKFCSHKCQGESKKTKILIECARCGKKIEKRPYVINSGYGKFCSHECADENRKENSHIEKICKQCGKTFLSLKSNTLRGNDLFCSARCRFAANIGENNPAWKGGKSFEPYCPKFNDAKKEEVRNRFGRTCFMCGVPENGRKLHVHHIDYNKLQGCKGQSWALLPLCISCHTKTSNNRHYYFNLLINYWAMNYEITTTQPDSEGFFITF